MESRSNRVLTIFFAALFFINVAYLLLGFASIPRYYERVTTLSIPQSKVSFATYPTNEGVQQSASEHGMTLPQYALEQILFHSAFVLLFMSVALLIVFRARWNWFAWFSAFFLVFIAEFALFDEIYTGSLLPLWINEAGSLLWPLILLYFYLFPNGKPVPRRALWVVIPFVVLHFAFQAMGFIQVLSPDAAILSELQGAVAPFESIVALLFLFIFGCQVYRYLRVSSQEEKQQTKWFLFGFVFFLVLSTVSDSLGSTNPYQNEVGLLIFAFVPLSVGVAILRYRLFDIDILIRRTLTYAIVAAVLALVYFGSVILLQQVFATLSGQRSEIITVLSTLAIAALFVPLRNRVQNTIDKRFNRKKYDAQQVLQKFGVTVRDETDLEKLTGRLIEVVDETMQPKSLSVWLRESKPRKMIE